MLVEALHPEWQPADAGFEERNAQFRKNIEHAAAHERRDPAHHLEWIRRRMLNEKIIAHLERAHAVRRARRAAVKAGGQVGLDARLPNRMERGMIEQLILHMRRQVDADAPRLVSDAA